MNHQSLRITAFDDSLWTGWPATEYGKTGLASRRLRSGHKHSLRLPTSETGESLAVLSLAAAPSRNPASNWRILLGGRPVAIHHRKTFPKHLLLELPPVTSSDGAELVFESTGAARPEHDLLIEEIAVMPRAGRFSELWTSPTRALKKLATKRRLPWAPPDFPYSHFDGLGYLLEHDEVRQAVLSREYDTAFRYWYSKGRHQGHPLPLAVEREPLPGTPFNLVMHYKGEYETGHSRRPQAHGNTDSSNGPINEELKLLLLELHGNEIALQDLANGNDILTKQHLELTVKLQQISAERDTLFKTSASNSKRVLELESKVADQSIVESGVRIELAKVEGQLTLLKSLLAQNIQPDP